MAKNSMPSPSRPLPPGLPLSAAAVRDALAVTLASLANGSLDAAQARALSSCSGMLLRAIQVADLEARLERLEALAEPRV